MLSVLDRVRERTQLSKQTMTLEEYLQLCKQDPLAYANAYQRLLTAVGEPTIIDTAKDARLGRVFQNRKLKTWDTFKDFYGMEPTIEHLHTYLTAAAQGLEEAHQILYFLGPVGGGKSSLAERLKDLMETTEFYAIKGCPIHESPLDLFDHNHDAQEMQDEFGIPRRYLMRPLCPHCIDRLKTGLDQGQSIGSIFEVEQLRPSRQFQVAIAKTEPADESTQDVSTLVGKVDVRRLGDFAQDDPKAYMFSGGLCKAHMGILDFVEMFKAPIKVLNPLLTATQEGNYNPTESLSALPWDGVICAHCFSADTELLTEQGWRGIDEVEVGDNFASLNPETGAVEYHPASKIHKYDYSGDMHHMSSSCADHLVTPNHKMLYESYGSWKECLAEDFYIQGAKVPVSGVLERDDLDLYTDDELRLLVWIVTDGSQRKNGEWRFHFKKQRKIDHLLSLINRLGYQYKISLSKDGERTYIYVKGVPSFITKRFGEIHRQLSARQTTILLKEWSYSDGSYASSLTENHFQLFTNVPFHRDLIQELATISGHKTTCAVAKKEGYQDGYLLHVRLETSKVRSDVINKGTVDYSGQVWCPDVAPYHTVIARRNGKVFISMNSNESEWDTFRNAKTNEAFLDRIYLVRVPYCLRRDEEIAIYTKMLKNSELAQAPCAAETLEMLAEWSVLSRLKVPENSTPYSKMKVYNGEILKDTDPKAKSLHEYQAEAGVNEGMTGMSTRFAFKVLSRTFNQDYEEIAANPVHLMHCLQNAVIRERLPEETEKAYLNYVKEYLQANYLKKLEKMLQQAYLESYADYGQNIFDRYFMYADAWIQETDFRDPETHQMWDREALNSECEKIEKPAGIANPKDFRNEIVQYVLRFRAAHGGDSPKWNEYEKIKEVIEARIFSNTEEILPVIAFGKKANAEDEKKHAGFVERMIVNGFTERQVRLLTDWFVRTKKAS